MEKVELGRKLVDEAGEAMDDIVTSVQLVEEIISGTATASREQSAGIEQVSVHFSDKLISIVSFIACPGSGYSNTRYLVFAS